MHSQSSRIPDEAKPSPERSGTEVCSRWLERAAGLMFLAIGWNGLRSDSGPERLGMSLVYLAMLLMGLKDLSIWILELFEWRRGRQLLAVRRWLLLPMFAALGQVLAGGLAWLLGY